RGAETDPRGLARASRQHGKLIAIMPFGDPGRLIAERLGELGAVDDLGGAGAARKRDPYSGHLFLLYGLRHPASVSGGNAPERSPPGNVPVRPDLGWRIGWAGQNGTAVNGSDFRAESEPCHQC